MSEKKVISGSDAVAQAVKLCKPKVLPMYPITPSTLIPEKLSEFIANGEMDAQLIHVESEHSAISALYGAYAAGVRTFTATASTTGTTFTAAANQTLATGVTLLSGSGSLTGNTLTFTYAIQAAGPPAITNNCTFTGTKL